MTRLFCTCVLYLPLYDTVLESYSLTVFVLSPETIKRVSVLLLLLLLLISLLIIDCLICFGSNWKIRNNFGHLVFANLCILSLSIVPRKFHSSFKFQNSQNRAFKVYGIMMCFALFSLVIGTECRGN